MQELKQNYTTAKANYEQAFVVFEEARGALQRGLQQDVLDTWKTENDLSNVWSIEPSGRYAETAGFATLITRDYSETVEINWNQHFVDFKMRDGQVYHAKLNDEEGARKVICSHKRNREVMEELLPVARRVSQKCRELFEKRRAIEANKLEEFL